MDNDSRNSLLRELPSVDELLREAEIKDASGRHSAPLVADVVRRVLDVERTAVLDGQKEPTARDVLVRRVIGEIASMLSPRMVQVINATGAVLHTNIGRAILAKEAIEAVLLAAGNNVNLELDMETGDRGQRDEAVEGLVKMLTGAESACVVNNNAAAVLITLNALAESREVVVSRGELIEIGGSFRLPEIIKKSGCILKEVGTTNRTHERDYEDAVNENTALLFKAHTSNYRVVGFTAEVSLQRLASIGSTHGLPVVEDLGSGSLVALDGLGGEPTAAQSLSSGASIVTFSGDKLLGGPQAGIIAGRRELVDRIRKNPLKRALRADKLTLAALEATLRLYLNKDTVAYKVPALRFLARPLKEIEAAAQEACRLIKKALGPEYEVVVEDTESVAGGGSMPGRTMPSKGVSVTHKTMGPDKIFEIFLASRPAILGRIKNERYILDMRTVEDPSVVVPFQTS